MVPVITQSQYCYSIPFLGIIGDAIKEKVAICKRNLSECCQCDYKTHILVIGRLLQALSIATTITSFACTLFVGPIALLGLVSSVCMAVLGTCLCDTQMQQPFSSMTPSNTSFIPGQPIGLSNYRGSTCWINSAMQCLLHIPELRQRGCLIPEIQRFVTYYEDLQRNAQSPAVLPLGDLNNFLIGQTRANQIRGEMSGRQADSSLFFEWLLNEDHFPLYQTTQTSTFNGVQQYSRSVSMDMIRVKIASDSNAPLQERNVPFITRFNQEFDYPGEDGLHFNVKFNALPEMLAVKIDRFYHRQNTDGSFEEIYIDSPIEGVDHLFTLNSSVVATGEQGSYACCAFIAHVGRANNGHYVSFVKKNGQWFCCNDSRVFPISDHDAHESMKRCFIFFANKQ